MNKHFAVSVIAASLVLACASIVFSQETKYPDILDAKPMFTAGLNHMNWLRVRRCDLQASTVLSGVRKPLISVGRPAASGECRPGNCLI